MKFKIVLQGGKRDVSPNEETPRDFDSIYRNAVKEERRKDAESKKTIKKVETTKPSKISKKGLTPEQYKALQEKALANYNAYKNTKK